MGEVCWFHALRCPSPCVSLFLLNPPPTSQANGNLVKVLIHTDVTKYLEFKAVDGSYVLNKGRVEKVCRQEMSF